MNLRRIGCRLGNELANRGMLDRAICLNLFPKPISVLPCNHLSFTATILAGSSKWHNIKGVKGANDASKARTIQMMCMRIGFSIREGGGSVDPKVNVLLAKVLDQCRALNVPKATIDKQLERAKNSPVSENYISVKGPGGCFLIFNVLAENEKRAINHVKLLTRKVGGFSIPDRPLLSFFQKKGVISIAKNPVSADWSTEILNERRDKLPANLDMTSAEDLAIEVGAEEVDEPVDETGDPTIRFICDTNDLKSLTETFETQHFRVKSSDVEFIAKHPVTLNDVHHKTVDMLFAFVQEKDTGEVVRIFDNIKPS